MELSPKEWNAVACSMADLELDPIEIACSAVKINGQVEFYNMTQIAQIVKDSKLVIFKLEFADHMDHYCMIEDFRGLPILSPGRNSAFSALGLSEDGPASKDSFIGCLHRAAGQMGIDIKYDIEKKAVMSLFQMSDVMILSPMG